MKVVILGDIHFGCGYSIGKIMSNKLNSRLIDYSNTFDYVIDYMVENDVSDFIITGDIFEHRRPQPSELSLFSEKIRRLKECNINTHIVIGNHDLIQEQKVTTIDVLQKLRFPKTFIYPNISSILCTDKKDMLNVIFLPYCTRHMLNCASNNEAINRLDKCLQYELNGITNNYPKILVGHFMLQNTKLGNVVFNDNIREIVLPIKIFNGLDAVIMGHVHSHQIIRQDPFITYVGSMERKNFGDVNINKYFLVVELKNKNFSFNFEKLPVRSLYDIVIDQSSVDNGEEVTEKSKSYLSQYNGKYNLEGSIIRVTIFLNNLAFLGFDKGKILSFIKDEMKVNYCSNIHMQIISKKQFRKDSITERRNITESFLDYLSLIDDIKLRERMKEVGLRIIKEAGK